MGVVTKCFTKTLTNDSLTLTEGMGVLAISILNESAVDGTILGTARLLGIDSDTVILNQGGSASYASIGNINGVVTGLTITAPSGCTLKITAQI
jgi:hypothetical protein